MIYLFRHGETRWNAEGRIQGWLDSSLTDLGLKQAQSNGRLLARCLERRPEGPAKTPLRFISSPLGRCLETARIIAEEIEFPWESLEHEPRLKEHGYGEWEGLRKVDVERIDPIRWRRREDDRWSVPAPGGESYEIVAERISDWLTGVCEQDRLVVVSHGCAGRILRGVYAGLDRKAIAALSEPQEGFYLLSAGLITFIDDSPDRE